nr:STAS domain-containing protein [Rubritepida sp.]
MSATFRAETDGGARHLVFAGALDAAAAAARWADAHRAARGAGRLVLDAAEVTALDSAGAALLVSLAEQGRAEWREPQAE